jgi:hypothetical protein
VPAASSSEAQELLAKLVAFDATSAKSNLELIARSSRTISTAMAVASTLIPSAECVRVIKLSGMFIASSGMATGRSCSGALRVPSTSRFG